MSEQKSVNTERFASRRAQSKELSKIEPNLLRNSADRNREDFFQQIVPHIQPLKNYIRRRLKIAYLLAQIQTPTETTGDLVDEIILEAYNNIENRPKNLSLEEWLYQIANRVVETYIKRAEQRDRKRRSYESLGRRELRTLEELEQVTADTEGEPYLTEDLDDGEYELPELDSPVSEETPEEELEKKEQIELILSALANLPRQELTVFQLYAMEGFSPEEIAKIMDISPGEVSRIVRDVRSTVLSRLGDPNQKAS